MFARVDNLHGTSILEVMVGLMIFSFGVLALSSTGYVASKALRDSRSYIGAAAAAQSILDSLIGDGWAAIAGQTGSDTIDGFPATWTVSGTDPLVVTVAVTRVVNAAVRTDSFITYVAK